MGAQNIPETNWGVLTFPDKIDCLKVSPDGRHLAAITEQYDLYITTLFGESKHREIHPTNATDWWHKTLAFSPDGKYLLTGNNRVCLYDVESAKSVQDFKLTKRSELRGFAFCPDPSHVASVSLAVSSGRDNALKLWDINSGKWIKSIPLEYEDAEMAVSPQGELTLLTQGPNQLLFFDPDNLGLLRTFDLPIMKSHFYNYVNLRLRGDLIFMNRAHHFYCYHQNDLSLTWEHDFEDVTKEHDIFFNQHNYGKFDISADGTVMIRIGLPDVKKQLREVFTFDLRKKKRINTYTIDEKLPEETPDYEYGQIAFMPGESFAFVALGKQLHKLEL